MNLRIALVGYGKMGQAIEQEAAKRGHSISFKISGASIDQLEEINNTNTDIAIEFTRPEAALDNFKTLLNNGVPVVSGTTGWLGDEPMVKEWVESHDGTFLFGSNFSVGVNVLFHMTRKLAALMNSHDQYDCYIEERHHKHKKDAPSGTALTLACELEEGLDRKKRVAHEELIHRPPKPDEISVSWIRSGEIFGEHTLSFVSEVDRISLKHEAFNRNGFALGAIIAAEWLTDKKGFFNFTDVFEQL